MQDLATESTNERIEPTTTWRVNQDNAEVNREVERLFKNIQTGKNSK